MEVIRYSIADKVLDVPLVHPKWKGFLIGAYKTVFANWVAEHIIVYRPSLDELGNEPLVRINSACFTSDIFGDQRCDCNEQLVAAISKLEESPGLVIYHLHHDGRGLGITSKLRTYETMHRLGDDTFSATRRLSNRDDLRTYGSAVLILKDLGITNLRLMSNNPEKRAVLEKNGIKVVDQINLVSSRPEIKGYLDTKRRFQGHAIPE